MSAVRAYAVWRAKEGVTINKDNVTYFSPGGFTFNHRSGEEVSFDFETSYGTINDKDQIIECMLKNIDNDFITESLEYDDKHDLIQDQYDMEFFRDGSFHIEDNEMHCCMDFMIDGKIIEEVDYTKFIEPVYLAIYDPFNTDEIIEFHNKLTEEEYKKYCR